MLKLAFALARGVLDGELEGRDRHAVAVYCLLGGGPSAARLRLVVFDSWR